jgi:hypothetical protein
MSLYAKDPIGEASEVVLFIPENYGVADIMAVEKCSLWVKLAKEMIKTCHICL